MRRITLLLTALLYFGLNGCNTAEEPAGEDESKIVINELLPKNSQYGSDQDGDFDDWIELYNLSARDFDISGYYLSDSKKNPAKWKFPAGTIIKANDYLIVWADEDSTHVSGLHTNYKLSADGENVVLLTPDKQVVDLVEYPVTLIEQSWARVPNGTGDFKWSVPTFKKANN